MNEVELSALDYIELSSVVLSKSVSGELIRVKVTMNTSATTIYHCYVDAKIESTKYESEDAIKWFNSK